MAAVLRGNSSIDLAELAQAIAADRNLRRRVIKAASQECGWPTLSIEQAIVLVGRERLADQFLHVPTANRIARWGTSRPPQPLQEEAE